MSSFIYPDSKTRKMFGDVGYKLQRKNIVYEKFLEDAEREKQFDNDQRKITDYKNLPWYTKLLIAITSWLKSLTIT